MLLPLLLVIPFFQLVYGQACGVYDDEPWPAITDLRTPTPLTLLYTYTVTECFLPTSETRTLTAYVPDGKPYHAAPAILGSSGTYEVSTVSFVFTSLFMTMLKPGEELELEYIPTNHPYPTEMSILTIPFADTLTSVITGFSISSTPTPMSTAQLGPPTTNNSTSFNVAGHTKAVAPRVVAGVIGGIAAVLVLCVLGWVILKAKHHREPTSMSQRKSIGGQPEITTVAPTRRFLEID